MKIKSKTKHLVCARILDRCEKLNMWIIDKEKDLMTERAKPYIKSFLISSESRYLKTINLLKNRQRKLIALYAYVCAQILSL